MVAGRQPVKLPFPLIEGLTRRQQEHLYLDFQALAEQGNGTRWATLVIAPSDATLASKRQADYVLDGTTDTSRVQAAVDSITNRATPGRIVFLEGTVYLTGAVTIAMSATTVGRLQLVGMGGYGSDTATVITNSGGSTTLFTCTGTSGSTTRVGFSGLSMSSGSSSCITTSATSVDIDACSFSGTGRLLDLNGGLSGPYAPSRIRNSVVTVSGSSSASRGIVVTNEFDTIITGCTITVTGGRALSIFSNAGATIRPNITNNHISGSTSASGVYLVDSTDATNVKDAVVANNTIKGFSIGIVLEGTQDTLITGNSILSCTDGIRVTGSAIIGNTRAMIVGNLFHDNTNEGVNIDSSTLGTSDIAVIANKFRGNTNQGSISSSCSNCAWAYNDSYSSGSFTDAGTSTRTEVSFLPATLDANARVGVRKNSAGSTVLRRRLNLIEGSHIGLTVADDSGSEEVDVTIAAASGGGTATYQVNGASVGAEATLNLVAGSGVTLVGADAGSVIDVTISAGTSAATAAGEFNYHFHG